MFRLSLTKTALLFFVLAQFGCASTHKPINPPILSYINKALADDSIGISYSIDVQRISNNLRYDKKEMKNNMTAIAVKVDNFSAKPIKLQKDNLKMFVGDNELKSISPTMYSSKIKQRVGAHLWHAAWGPWTISWEEDQYGEKDVSFIYLPVGAIVGIGNAIRANKANKANNATLVEHQLWDKVVGPGETGYGVLLVPRHSAQKGPITFRYSNSPIRAVEPERNIATEEAHFNEQMKKAKSRVYSFYVILKDKKRTTINSKIHTNTLPHSIEDASVTITPDQTVTISRMTEQSEQKIGISYGNVWLFKVISGRISTYYPLSDGKESHFTHIQKDNGPIVPFSPESLAPMINDDQFALEIMMTNPLKAILAYNTSYQK